MTPELLVALATFLLVLVTALLALVTLRGIREQLWLVTFAEYTRRYSEIMEELPFEARRPDGDFDISALPVKERERALGAIRRYLNLCSEEHYLHQRKKVDDETWSIWTVGMRDTIRLPWLGRAWELLRSEYSYYPGFCTFVDHLEALNRESHERNGSASKKSAM